MADDILPCASLVIEAFDAALFLDPAGLEDYLDSRELDAWYFESGENPWNIAEPIATYELGAERRAAADARLLLATLRRIIQALLLMRVWAQSELDTAGPEVPAAEVPEAADAPSSRRSHPLNRHAPPTLDTSSIDMSIVALAA